VRDEVGGGVGGASPHLEQANEFTGRDR
jgi:hypothetical protein